MEGKIMREFGLGKRYSHTALSSMVVAGAALLIPSLSSACSSCGCTLSSDWASQGIAAEPGVRMDLRYDYLNQSQLRGGTGTVDRAGISLPSEREIEEDTKNQYTTLGVDYNPNRNWGVNVQIPYINRTHTTIAEGDTDISSSKTNKLGDVRVIGRYQGLSADGSIGIQAGLKLPTGAYKDNFNGGPQAGQPLDRGLQAGTGTTDLLVGLYNFGSLNRDWDYFTQGMVQQPLSAKDGYKTGLSLNVNFGVRYMSFEGFIPQLQINGKTARKDSGENADVDNSGGTLVYLSPGVSAGVTKNVSVYGFVQAPLYQNVNGYQLAPRYTASLGLRYSM